MFQYIPDLIMNLGISEIELNRILDATIPYIDSDQPVLLQQHCVAFLDKLIAYDAATIYVKLYQTKRPYANTFEMYSKSNVFSKMFC